MIESADPMPKDMSPQTLQFIVSCVSEQASSLKEVMEVSLKHKSQCVETRDLLAKILSKPYNIDIQMLYISQRYSLLGNASIAYTISLIYSLFCHVW